MTLKVAEPIQADAAINELIAAIHEGPTNERRSDVRYPFFRPLSVQMAGRRYSAFGREISASGIGMLHNFELSTGEAEIDIPKEPGQSIRVRTRIHWCRSCGEGWFISAGEFIGPVVEGN